MINITAIVDSVEKNHSHYEEAIKTLANLNLTKPFKADDVDMSGNTLTGLANYGVLKIVGTTSAMVCINEYSQTYKKMQVNLYQVACDIDELAKTFNNKKKEVKVQKIEDKIKVLREKLANALAELDDIQ